jgi:hypothetical protein
VQRYAGVPAPAPQADPFARPLQFRLVPNVQLESPANAAAFRGESSGQPDIHAAAEAGVSGSRTELPHATTIQSSFGRHDLSGVNAHVGGPATDACDAMNANAYARGNDVAFAAAPDLHTAAHEAAHVVQQRSGVQLYGGVGKAGDAYEQQADRVADLVVAGQSAEAELGQVRGADAAVGSSAVQRDAKPETYTKKDHGTLMRLLLRATAAEAKQALADVDAAEEAGAELYTPFFAGCTRTDTHLREATQPAPDGHLSSVGDYTAAADLAYGWVSQLLEQGQELGVPESLPLAVTLERFTTIMQASGWAKPASVSLAKKRAKKGGQEAKLSESERQRTIELALETADAAVSGQLAKIGEDSAANRSFVETGVLLAHGHLEYVATCLESPTAASPGGTGDPYEDGRKNPRSTKAGKKVAVEVEQVLVTLDQLFTMGARNAAESSMLQALFVTSLELKHQAGVAFTPVDPSDAPATTGRQDRMAIIATNLIRGWVTNVGVAAGEFQNAVEADSTPTGNGIAEAIVAIGIKVSAARIFKPLISAAGIASWEGTGHNLGMLAYEKGLNSFVGGLRSDGDLHRSPQDFATKWETEQSKAAEGHAKTVVKQLRGLPVTEEQVTAMEADIERWEQQSAELATQELLRQYLHALYYEGPETVVKSGGGGFFDPLLDVSPNGDDSDGGIVFSTRDDFETDGLLVIHQSVTAWGRADLPFSPKRARVPNTADVSVHGLDTDKLTRLVDLLGGSVDPVRLGIAFAFKMSLDTWVDGRAISYSDHSLYFNNAGVLQRSDPEALTLIEHWGGKVPVVGTFGNGVTIVGWSTVTT